MEETGSEVDFLEVPEARQLTVDELEDQVLEDPDNPDTHRALGEALLAAGESPRGQEELELALSAYENREDWDHASDLVSELIRLDPSGVRYHQKRVELAFRGGDRTRLLDAYVELGDALMRVGALDKAVAVYRRVAEHDPDNARAQAALDSLAPPEEAPPAQAGLEAEDAEGEIDIREATEDELAEAEPSPRSAVRPACRAPMFAPSSDFVDLGSLILDDERPRDLRMRVEDEEPTGDEQKDFQEMLTQFKRGVDENIGAEDFQAHYDLGVAFREMGLLDEAIAEFQKALRAPEGQATDLRGAGHRVLRQEAVRDRRGDPAACRGEPGCERRGADRPALLAGPRARRAGEDRCGAHPATSGCWRWISASRMPEAGWPGSPGGLSR